jgi:hypothetical protein
MPNRIERLKQYANPRSRENWNGASRDQKNIDRWSQRARDNSLITDKPDRRPTRDPLQSKARADVNHVGDGDYLSKVRRTAN